MVLAQFRQKYPQGSLVSELVDIDRGTYIVKVSVKVNDLIFTALAGAEKVETAEDLARERAIATLFLDSPQTPLAQNSQSNLSSPTNSVNSAIPVSPNSHPPDRTPTSMPRVNNANIAHSAPVEVVTPPINQTIEPEIPEQVTELVTPELPPQTAVKPETTIPEKQPVENGNLFEGTYNPQLNVNTEENISSETSSSQVEETPTHEETKMTDFKFMEIKQKTDLEIRRLGWTKDYGREFLMSHYGKRTRLHLTNEELLQFLQYLESQPTPS